MNKQDLRVIKTRNILCQTLIELLKDKTFEEIKVSDICSRALVNRSTFYAHYNDKYELLMDFINNLKSELQTTLDKNIKNINTKEYYMEMIRLVLDHIDERKDIYYSVIMNNRNSIVLDILIDVTVKDISSKFSNSNSTDIPNDILIKYYLGAVACVGLEWIKGNNKYSKKDILNYLEKLLPENIGN